MTFHYFSFLNLYFTKVMNSKTLLLDLSKRETEVFEKNTETSLIPQLDGEPSKDDTERKYELTSSYAEEDNVYNLEKIFPDTKLNLG